MLYETLSQPTIFLCLSLTGFCAGFLFDFKNIFCLYFKHKKIISQILLFFATFFTFFAFFYANLKINYGQFRFFAIIGFMLSFLIQRFISKNFLAKTLITCYNKLKAKRDGKRKKMVEKS